MTGPPHGPDNHLRSPAQHPSRSFAAAQRRWQQWWVPGVWSLGAGCALALLGVGVRAADELGPVFSSTCSVFGWLLLWGGASVLAVDRLVAQGARRGGRGSQRYFRSLWLRIPVRTAAVVAGLVLSSLVHTFWLVLVVVVLLVLGLMITAKVLLGTVPDVPEGACWSCSGSGQRRDHHPTAGSYTMRCGSCQGTGRARRG